MHGFELEARNGDIPVDYNVAAKLRGGQGTQATFFNATTSAAQRAPAETRFDDLGGR